MYLSEESSGSVPGWITAGERCLAHLLGTLGFVRQQELPALVDAAFLLETLGEALTRLLEAFRFDADPPLALRAAVSQLDQALAALRIVQDQEPVVLELVTHIQEARTMGSQAAERSLGLVWSAPPSVEDQRASTDLLRLHARVFPPLLPVPVVHSVPFQEVTETPATPPNPTTFAELEAALSELKERAANRKNAPPAQEESGEKPTESPTETAEEPPYSEQDFLRQRSRECFEDLAMLCTQRAPQLGEYWRDVEVLETRMRASIDAIVSLGRPGLTCLAPDVLEAPALDPPRLTAFALLCGAVDGRDSLALAEWTFHQLLASFPDASAELHEAFGEALGLAPHPEVARVCEGLLRSPDAQLRALAIDVLGWRGEATSEQLLAALADEPQVAAVALPLYVSSWPVDLRDRIEECLRRDHPLLNVAAWRSMVLAADPRLNGLLRHQLRGVCAEDAALLFGLHAERRDADVLLEEAATSPTPALVEALGFAGSPGCVPLLIGLLDVDDFELQLATSTALIRITGQELWEEVRLPAERVQADSAPAGNQGQPPPDEGSDDTIELPTLRSEPWRAYWHHYGGHFDPALRYRRGRPHEALVLIDELSYCRIPRRQRQAIIWELMSRSKHSFRLDPRSWANQQWSTLQGIRELTSSSASAGSWALPARR